MAKSKLVSPFVKWVGGKRQIINDIKEYLPRRMGRYTYVEPFIGGGAVLFNLQPRQAIINDLNSELINVYKVIRDNLDELLEDLKKHRNEPDYFYELRGLDRTADFNNINEIERASRFIFLNKTCYNGLYRVNNAGKFNTPFGRYKNPNIINKRVLKAVSRYLNKNEVQILNKDYKSVLEDINENHFVYFDPPYHPISESSNFTGYIQGGWNETDQRRLRDVCNDLNERGIRFLLSNSACEFIEDLYQDYNINIIRANRCINAVAARRGEVDELLIRNYE